MTSTSPDNRRLLVEVLHGVHGLDKRDLEAVEVVNYAGAGADPRGQVDARDKGRFRSGSVGWSPRRNLARLRLRAGHPERASDRASDWWPWPQLPRVSFGDFCREHRPDPVDRLTGQM
jgi:hypothetical protein